GLQTTSTPGTSTQNHPESTYDAAMIYYRKTLSSSGPKLTAVQVTWKSSQKKLNPGVFTETASLKNLARNIKSARA
ncbi:hypothetical protein, partial [Polynucleobacter nymphae]|uniref:hypothetical protein n=1 Tax=Polynucleobacter nymphae TaxID=2081043 RepID=UPI001C0CB791